MQFVVQSANTVKKKKYYLERSTQEQYARTDGNAVESCGFQIYRQTIEKRTFLLLFIVTHPSLTPNKKRG